MLNLLFLSTERFSPESSSLDKNQATKRSYGRSIHTAQQGEDPMQTDKDLAYARIGDRALNLDCTGTPKRLLPCP